ncbi:MAG TPA: LysM domain-containing protein, partial [Chthoniobacterales bacterium]|nr:LysM domain-containing protein [Chthoniobacterales bacterium]
LHIVAVAGIVAFNTIKTRENFTPATPETIAPATASATPAIAADSAATAPNESSTAAAKAETKAVEETSSAPAKSSVKDSGKIYTVVRGDNPVTIARHLKVAEADLLELNQITDPRKLQINQKLRIPERTANNRKHSSD